MSDLWLPFSYEVFLIFGFSSFLNKFKQFKYMSAYCFASSFTKHSLENEPVTCWLSTKAEGSTSSILTVLNPEVFGYFLCLICRLSSSACQIGTNLGVLLCTILLGVIWCQTLLFWLPIYSTVSGILTFGVVSESILSVIYTNMKWGVLLNWLWNQVNVR